MNNQIPQNIVGLYRFSKVDPITYERKQFFCILDGDNFLVEIFEANQENAEKAKLAIARFANQRGYKTAKQVLADKNLNLELDNRSMQKILHTNYGINNFSEKYFGSVKQARKTINQWVTNIGEQVHNKLQGKVKRLGLAAGVAGLATMIGITGLHLNKKPMTNTVTLKNNTKSNDILLSDVQAAAPKAVQAPAKTVQAPAKTVQAPAKTVQETFNQNTASYITLVNNTKNEVKTKFMSNFNSFMGLFNGPFASTHKDADKSAKLCLSTEEAAASFLAYNGKSLTNEELAAIFDETKLDKGQLIENYKSGYLQLMLAGIVQTSPTRVDLLINSDAGKAMYQKYEDMNIAFNTATNESAKKEIAANFVSTTIKDFQLDATKGNFEHQTIEDLGIKDSYTAVLPIIAAMHTKTINYGDKYSFTDAQIEALNNEALCDLAAQNIEDAVTRLQMMQMLGKTATSDPSYANYMRAIKQDLKAKGNYELNDRDISVTELFKKQIGATGVVMRETKNSVQMVGPSTQTKTWSESKTEKTGTKKAKQNVSRDTAVKAVGKKEVKAAEKKVDQKYKDKTQENKEKAEKEADKKQKEQQAVEDEKGKEIDKKVDDYNQKVENEIKDTSDKHDAGDKVSGTGDHYQVDESHTDEEGNINNSVTDVTTDNSNVSADPLPDPNAMGENTTQSSVDTGKVEEYEEPVSKQTPSVTPSTEAVSVEEVPTQQAKQASVEAAAKAIVDALDNADANIVYNPNNGTLSVEEVPTEQETVTKTK